MDTFIIEPEEVSFQHQAQDSFECALKKADSTNASDCLNEEPNPERNIEENDQAFYDLTKENYEHAKINKINSQIQYDSIFQQEQSLINSEQDAILYELDQVQSFYPTRNQIFQHKMKKIRDEKLSLSQKDEEETMSSQSYKIFFKLKNKIFHKTPLQKICQRNKNMPTFLTRMFLKYHWQYKKYYDKFPAIYNRIPKSPEDLNQCFGQTKAFNIKHLNKLINGQENDYEYSRLNRMVFKLILRDHLYDQVIANGQCKLKKTYLNMSKVFSLRCISSKLIQRMKSK